jgi:hypothetical protein
MMQVMRFVCCTQGRARAMCCLPQQAHVNQGSQRRSRRAWLTAFYKQIPLSSTEEVIKTMLDE